MQLGTSLTIVVMGGGAAGIFGAIAAAEAHPHARVIVLEKSRQLLSKVRISGGGRCNVTHACFDPIALSRHYPRGSKALVGPFSRFQPRDTIAWFEARGVRLKTEGDGRIFPVTDSSETIIECLLSAASKAGVKIWTEVAVQRVEKRDTGFLLHLRNLEPLFCNRLLLASGSAPAGLDLAASLGHTLVPPVPSLFTFNIADKRLEGLSGVSVDPVHLKLKACDLSESGPLLITHWGMSGPAVLKLSAWGARTLHSLHYKTELTVNWLPAFNEDALRSLLLATKEQRPQKTVAAESCVALPKSLWKSLVVAAQIAEAQRWSHLSSAQLRSLLDELLRGRYLLDGKSAYKEEFVTSGGVDLKEVDFKRFESRLCPGLHFAGEVLDIDGVTGGFNFQNAWTGSFIAAQSMHA